MGRLVVVENVTLDGVMQGPARPDEDRRDGFVHGGWGRPYPDHVMAEKMGVGRADPRSSGGGLLLGRRTFEDFAEVWPGRTDNPFTPVLTASTKYVATRSGSELPEWENTVPLVGDAGRTVADLKADVDLTVLGSGELVRALVAADLVDEFQLLVHPLVLGGGRRLFAADGPRRDLRLVDSVVTTTGVIIATYRPA